MIGITLESGCAVKKYMMKKHFIISQENFPLGPDLSFYGTASFVKLLVLFDTINTFNNSFKIKI